MDNNNKDIKLCPACGAKNKSAYKYCNECGAALNQYTYTGSGTATTPPMYNNIPPQQGPQYRADRNQFYGVDPIYYNGQFGQGGYTPYPPYGTNMNAPYMGTPDFDGVSAKDVYDFTGAKAELFYKMRIQHFSGKTGPYCWPLFVLGLIFGFFGMGCWYLYHKLYKPAAIFFAASIAKFALTLFTVFSVFDAIIKAMDDEFLTKIFNNPELYYNDYYGLTEELLAKMQQVPQLTFFSETLSGIMGLTSLVLTIVLPFFAYKQYKNYALNKIRAEYSKSPMPAISPIGGLKSGLVTMVSIISGIAVVFSFIYLVNWFADGVVRKVEKFAEENDISEPYEDYYEYMPFDDGGLEFNDGSGEIW